MPRTREFSRVDRVGATVQRALAGPLGDIARREGAGLVTVTRVEVSPDLRHATGYLSVYGGDLDAAGFLRVLRPQAHVLQAVLARELRTRRTPVLSFRIDDGIARADRINRLLGEDAVPESGR